MTKPINSVAVEIDAARLHKAMRNLGDAIHDEQWQDLPEQVRLQMRSLAGECRDAILGPHRRAYSDTNNRSGVCAECQTQYPCNIRRFFTNV
ncbi:hypothetical protein SEA_BRUTONGASTER_79 [Gordonia phage BrutonGaster]|uniref:Uncharacterized protein n=1 Tax=Gordonia phage BrutonGaster TaxID=2530116 RepID=A0A482JH86_9CAUD|nr:hypothetical protein HOV26_gp103 [Gordonia phage BrutonGaster]QBP33295.1 hypothetical protein SEA_BRUTONGASTER_79 [Gordonia phage BrutonGaster]